MVVMSLRIVGVLSLLEFCKAYTAPANPPMLTHASMDVGNIISIVIPESPDENINVEQLTGEFRQQLERIKKQSRASKVEHGLVTLKRVLPEMSREEKRKTLPLIRRVLHGRRVPTGGRNWTREASQIREGGQIVRSRSPGNIEERRIYRDYEEAGNRESATTRIEQLVVDRDDYRRINDRNYANRRDEDSARRGEQIRQDELIRHEESGRREERIIFAEEDPSKISRTGTGQEWGNWDDQSRGDTRIYPETSTIECGRRSDHGPRQKEPGNEIVQGERLEKLGRFEPRGSEEPNVDCTKVDQQINSRYPLFRQDTVENGKRGLKDTRSFEVIDVPAFVNYPREYDVNGALNLDCDVNKNRTGQPLKDRDVNLSLDKQRQENVNFEREAQRPVQTIVIQEPREQFERSNSSGFENIVGESVDEFSSKKKLGQTQSEDFRGSPSMKSSPGTRLEHWNVPVFDDRRSSNSSDDVKSPPNVYEMFGEKDINPGLAYIQTDQGIVKESLDNEPKIAASQQLPNYGNGRILRIQRAINKNKTLELSKNLTEGTEDSREYRIGDSIFGKLKRLFKSPTLPNVTYNRIILVYANESTGYNNSTREMITQLGKSPSTVSSSMVEPTSSTRHKIQPLGSTTDSPQIKAIDDHVVKPHNKF